MNWRTILPVWCVVAVLVLVAMVAIDQSVKRASQTKLAEALANQANVSELAERVLYHQWQTMLRQVENLHRIAGDLANAMPIGDSEAVLKGGSTAPGRVQILANALELADQNKFLLVTLVNAGGVAVWSTTTGGPISFDLNDREHIRAVLREGRRFFVGRSVLGRVSGQITIQFTDAIHDWLGHLVGVSVVSVSAQSVRNFLVDMRLGPRDAIAIIRDDGVVLASSSDDLVDSVLDASTVAELVAVKSDRPRMLQLRPSRLSLVRAFRSAGQDHWVAMLVDYEDAMAETLDLNTQQKRYGLVLQFGALLAGITVALAFALFCYIRRLVKAKRSVELAMQVDRDFAIAARVGPGVLYRVVFDHTDRPTIAMVSDSVEQLTGYVASEIKMSKILAKIIDSNTRPILLAAIYACREGQPQSLEFRLCSRDGRRIWVQNNMKLYIDSTGGRGIIGYLLDISVAKEQAYMMTKLGNLATLGEISAGIAHELNLPIATIAIAAENICHEIEALPDDHARRIGQAVERIATQARRAIRLMDHIRIFGRTDDASRSPVVVNQAITGAMLLVNHRIRTSRVRMDIRIAPDLPLITGHQVLLEQVLVNLLVNVIDAYEDGEALNRPIVISAEARGNIVWISVADRAGGIDAEDLERVFEPFYSTKKPGQGTGLGLSFSRRVVQEMGGTISVEREGGGSVFTLVLQAFGTNACCSALSPAGEARKSSVFSDGIVWNALRRHAPPGLGLHCSGGSPGCGSLT